MRRHGPFSSASLPKSVHIPDVAEDVRATSNVSSAGIEGKRCAIVHSAFSDVAAVDGVADCDALATSTTRLRRILGSKHVPPILRGSWTRRRSDKPRSWPVGGVGAKGFGQERAAMESGKRLWLEESIQENLKWMYSVDNILHKEASKFQDVELIESGPFGKVLLLDGKLQSAEADEFVYHECLVHPALLHHPNPKKVFIMGGGEGSTAREVLLHKSVEKVVMVDIDEVVVQFCKEHLDANREAFEDPRLKLMISDARKELMESDENFDVIIGDLADPVYGGPCYQLYTQEFYETVVKQKLNPGGIFVTQSGPGGILSHTEVFTSINRTLATVFPTVIGYTTHLPSFADTWSWNMAFTDPEQKLLTADEVDKRIATKVTKDLGFLDGATMQSVATLNKHVRKGVENEDHIYTLENPKFIHGQGLQQEDFLEEQRNSIQG